MLPDVQETRSVEPVQGTVHGAGDQSRGPDGGTGAGRPARVLKKTVWRALSWGGKVRGLVSVSWFQTNEAEDGFSRLYMKRERERKERETLERNVRERETERVGVGGAGAEKAESEEKSSFYWYKHTKPENL